MVKRPLWLPPVDQSAMLFALRTTLASLIALYIGFLMSMDDPKWAAMTVWIVAQQSRGMSRSKAIYRAGGTFLGAAVAIFLIALFGQAPEILLLGLATWIGCCVAVATGLRNFRAYGAVLAGYTAAIITLDVARQPGEVFSIALSRTTYILLGLVCEGVAGAVFSLSQPENDLRGRLSILVADAARVCERALRGETTISQSIRKLFADALNVDTSAAYAAAVSSDAFAVVRTVRYVAGAVLEQLIASQAISDHRAQAKDGSVLLDAVADTLSRAPSALPYGVEPLRRSDYLDELAGLRERVDKEQHTRRFSDTLTLERLGRLIGATQALGNVIDQSARSWRSRVTAAPVHFSFVVDRTAALVNGLRAFFAVLLAALIWIAFGWDSGAGFVTITGVVCALFATRPNPTAGSWAFFEGAFIASPIAAICNFWLLPAGSGFVWLTLSVAPFLFVGGLALRNPRTAGIAAGFTIFVLDLIGPRNNGQADPTAFFNGALTLCGGIAFGALVFHMIAPSDAASVRVRLHRSLMRDLERLAERPGRWSSVAWLGRIADSVNRQTTLAASLSAQQVEADFRFTLAISEIASSMMVVAGLQQKMAAAAKANRARSESGSERATAGASDFERYDHRLLNRIARLFMTRMAEVSARPARAARAARLGAQRLAFVLQRHRLAEARRPAAAPIPIATEMASMPAPDEGLNAALLETAYALQRAADALDAHIVSRQEKRVPS